MSAIAQRARDQIDEAARRAVERYRSEIADYAASRGTLIDGEVLSVTRRSYEMLCDRLASESPPSPDTLDEMRRAVARRVHQDGSPTSTHPTRHWSACARATWCACARRHRPPAWTGSSSWCAP